MFKIRQEGSVAAGVRRIEALTGYGIYNYIQKMIAVIGDAAVSFKLNDPRKLAQAAAKIAEELREKDREIAQLKTKLALANVDGILANSVDVDGVSVITSTLNDIQGDQLKDICSICTDRKPNSVVVVCGLNGGKGTFACAVGKEALGKKLNAGKIVKAVAQAARNTGVARI